MRGLKILDRYIIRKFLTTFFVAIGLIILVVIVFDVSEKIDDFIKNKAPLEVIIFQYYFNFIPYFICLFSHLFCFISVIFFTSKLAANSEFIAILSSGISFWRILRPYLYSAFLIASLNFVLLNFVIPHVNKGRIDFEREYIRLRRNFWKDIHIQSAPNTQVYASSFDNFRNAGGFFSYEKYDEHELKQKITASTFVFDSTISKWHLYNYTIRNINKDFEHLDRGDSMTFDCGLTPRDFTPNSMNIQVMDFFTLNAYIEQERSRGSTYVTTYLIEKYQRILNPIAIFILTIMGVSLSCRKTRGGVGLHLALGVGLAFLFIILMKVSTVFSTKGTLPPLGSTLVPLLLFSIIAFVLARKSPK